MEWYGLRTSNQAPKDPDLKPWEDDFSKMFSNLSKREYKNDFQNKLRDIERSFQSSDKIVISSDKTDNFYLIEKSDYTRHLRNAITQNDKKSSLNEIEEADYNSACIA